MGAVGLVLVGLGFLLVGSGWLYDTAPEGTHNLGLLQTQMMLIHVGLGVMIGGFLLAVVSVALERLQQGDGSRGMSKTEVPLAIVSGVGTLAIILLAVLSGGGIDTGSEAVPVAEQLEVDTDIPDIRLPDPIGGNRN